MNSFLSIGFILFFACSEQPQFEEFKWSGKTMGTTYSIKVIAEPSFTEKIDALSEAVETRLQEVNQSMSTYIPSSEISQFNRLRDTSEIKISDDFYYNLSLAKHLSEETNGAFDVTVMPLVNYWGFGWKGRRKAVADDQKLDSIGDYVGFEKLTLTPLKFIKKSHPNTQIDLSATAKGFGVDAIANVVKRFGASRFMVEIGGEVVTAGKNVRNENWRIGIDKPNDHQSPGKEFQKIIQLSNAAMATSGDYRIFYEQHGKRFSHVIDPRTRKPIQHQLASVTVIAPTCAEADGIATTLLVLGEKEGFEWVRNKPDVEAFFITREGNGFKEFETDGFSKYVLK